MYGKLFAAWALCSLILSCSEDTQKADHFVLTVNVTPAGLGRVVTDDGQVDCTGACTYQLKKGSSVSLAAEPGVDHKLDGWSGACSGSGLGLCSLVMNANTSVSAAFSPGVTANELSPGGDLDGDGLTNGEELDTYGTSPWLEDTDGDGYSDYDEVVTYGFDATNDPFKFNPLVADVPKIKITLVSPPAITLEVTSTTSGSTTITAGSSRETSTEVSNTETTTNTTSVENSVNKKRFGLTTRWGQTFSPDIGLNDYKTKTTEENSFSWSQTQSTENSQAFNESTSMTQEEGFAYLGGRLSMLVQVENNGNIAFTLDNLVLGAIQLNATADGTTVPIGNLSFDSTDGAFPSTTLGPGEARDSLVFDKDDMDLNTTLGLLRDSRGLLVSATTYELIDANGVPFNHALTQVRAKTAMVIVDYGPGTGRSPEYHMVATNLELAAPGVTLDRIFADHLYIPYTVDSGLASVRDVAANSAERKDWTLLHLYKDAGEQQVAFYNSEVEAYDFEAINLRAGDVLHLIFRDDADDDSLGQRGEFLFGSNPALADTDADGHDDGTEVYGYAVAGVTLNDAVVTSNPTLADTDIDGVSDGDEVTARTDPSSRFPITYRSGAGGTDNAIALDAVADGAGNLYVVGYGTNLPSLSGGKDWWIKMIDAAGVEVWDRRFEGGADGEATWAGDGGVARAVALSPLGELYVVGHHSLNYHNSVDQPYWWVKKLNAWDGVEITDGWDKGFDRDVNGSYDAALDVAIDSAGNVYVVGYASKLSSATSGRDWLIKKFSAAGVEDGNWNKTFNNADLADEAAVVVIDSQDNVYVGGYSTHLQGPSTGKDWRIVKFNSSGDTLWTSVFDSGHNQPDVITGMDLDAAGDLYVSGYGTDLAGQGSGIDGVLRKLTGADGVMVTGWQKVISGQGSGSDVAYDVVVSDDDNVYVVGSKSSMGSQWFVNKYATDGTADIAAQGLELPSGDGYSLDAAHGIAKGRNGVFYVVGSEGLYPDQNPDNATPDSWWLEKFYDVVLPELPTEE